MAESVDAARPLSEEGKAEAMFAANAIAAYLELPSSEFMRARTAVTFPPFSGLMLEGRSVTSTLTDH